jgi:Flp pilus assembly protein TadG
MSSQKTFWRRADAAVMRSARLLRALLRPVRHFPWREGRERGCLRGEEGTELVEFALTLPILLGLIFGLMQVCLALYTHEYLSELAREGTRYAMVHGPTCKISGGASCTATAANVNSYVAGLGWPNLGGVAFSASNVTTTFPGTGGQLVGNPVVVTVTYQFPYNIPFVTSKTLSLASTSEMYIIQ